MLVLTRGELESIWIGNNIKITIVGIDRGRIRIGIEAPRNIEVLRTELLRDGDQRLNKYIGHPDRGEMD